MTKQKAKKLNVLLYSVVLFFVIVMLVLMAISYFKRVDDNKLGEQKVNNLNMLISFDKNNQINVHGLHNGYNESREFTIENYSKDTIGNYQIVFEVITPLSNMIDENFVYDLIGETDSKDKSNNLINVANVPVPVITKSLTGGVITPNTTHKYKVTFRMNNSKIKYPNDNLFSLKIYVKSSN